MAINHSEEIKSLKITIREQAEENNRRKGMSMPQLLFLVKYVAYEMGC